jgi:hypothetical protein
MRRKKLGADRCFCCPESDMACLESDHPVGEERDKRFHRAVCRNCHRKVEWQRDFQGLTTNGLHKTRESKLNRHISYLSLLAVDQESIAQALESEHASIPLTVVALKATAASIRREVERIHLWTLANSHRAAPQRTFKGNLAR